MVNWVESKFVGGVSEVTLLTPIKKGLVPGEFWTYEQRLHRVLADIQSQVEKSHSTPIQLVPVIHFARWLILRPEQYLFPAYLFSSASFLAVKRHSPQA